MCVFNLSFFLSLSLSPLLFTCSSTLPCSATDDVQPDIQAGQSPQGQPEHSPLRSAQYPEYRWHHSPWPSHIHQSGGHGTLATAPWTWSPGSGSVCPRPHRSTAWHSAPAGDCSGRTCPGAPSPCNSGPKRSIAPLEGNLKIISFNIKWSLNNLLPAPSNSPSVMFLLIHICILYCLLVSFRVNRRRNETLVASAVSTDSAGPQVPFIEDMVGKSNRAVFWVSPGRREKINLINIDSSICIK